MVLLGNVLTDKIQTDKRSIAKAGNVFKKRDVVRMNFIGLVVNVRASFQNNFTV